tara:strand:- start:348 stop:524 length:177 start_codon:yes stop_codon:yes gene_type:complete
MAEVNKAARRAVKSPAPVVAEVKNEATPPIAEKPAIQPKTQKPAKKQAKKKTSFFKKV